MFVAERQKKIKQILFEQKYIDVSSLSEMLNVSEVTVRRDLDKLEKEGFLLKSYGGATLNQSNIPEEIADEDLEDKYLKEKRYIASIACQFIRNNEAIFLGAGTTCMQIAKSLSNIKRLTVVTNDIAIATELMNYSDIKIIMSGGEICNSSTTIGGYLAEQLLKSIYVDVAFIGAKGIDIDRGYTTYDIDESLVYKTILSVAKESIVVADYSKFGNVGFAKIADLGDIKKVISNKQIDDKYKNYFFENNIKLYTTYQID